jgi:hypothetical protein
MIVERHRKASTIITSNRGATGDPDHDGRLAAGAIGGASTIIPMVKRMPPVPGSGSAFPSWASWLMGKQREGDAAKFERRELAVVDDLWPAEVAVEVAEADEIARSEGDEIGEGCRGLHGESMGRTCDVGVETSGWFSFPPQEVIHRPVGNGKIRAEHQHHVSSDRARSTARR